MDGCLDGFGVVRVSKPFGSANSVEVHLAPQEVLTLQGDQRNHQVVALSGNLWVTQFGDGEDHVLKAGERFTITNRGNVLIESLHGARVRLVAAN